MTTIVPIERQALFVVLCDLVNWKKTLFIIINSNKNGFYVIKIHEVRELQAFEEILLGNY